MSYHPYPNADRALRQVARRAPAPQPSELQLSMAEQANAVLALAGAAFRPFLDGLRRPA
ncbi:hypothetical protein [Streptomyces sp. NPDC096153]|uniref:hypothetical protein n=1 Tax=Streptomyces sp. NPDC096153 TaxID=3155548 RepID=UPI00332ABB3D